HPQSSAHPSGLINISSPPGEKAAMTLTNGVLNITGHRSSGADIQATGTLTVGIAQTASGLALSFTETGVAAAERALGISSPFEIGGKPTTVPVKLMNRFTSC